MVAKQTLLQMPTLPPRPALSTDGEHEETAFLLLAVLPFLDEFLLFGCLTVWVIGNSTFPLFKKSPSSSYDFFSAKEIKRHLKINSVSTNTLVFTLL